MTRQRPMSRRTFGHVLLAGPLLAGALAASLQFKKAAANDIDVLRTDFYEMMEITPDRPGAHGDRYPVTSFGTLIMPESGHSLALQATTLPDGPATGATNDEWQTYFGFSPLEIHAFTIQDDDTGFLMIIDGHFDLESRDRIIATWESNNFAPMDDNDQDVVRYIWSGLDNYYPTTDLPHLTGLQKGHYAVLSITQNGKVVVTSDPDLAMAVHLAERKRTSYMTFAPGVSAALRHEPPGVFEAISLPGNRFSPPDSTATPVSSDGIVSGLHGVTAMTHVDHPDWTIIASVDHVDIDDTDSGEVYARQVESRFAQATSAMLDQPFPEIMSLDAIETSFSTVVLTFSPIIHDPPDILQLARQGDLEFLIPSQN